MKLKPDLNQMMTLSAEEASVLSGIGIRTIYRMMNNPQYDFVLWIGKKRRIKREAFEKMISETTYSSFESWRNHYRKEIDPYDECVEECYDISFHVVYDVGISGVDDDWRLLGDSNLAENIVYLNDGNNHDGWEYVDRGWSRKKIDLRDVEDQYLLKEICIKNGVKCIPKINEKVHLTKEDFVEFWVKNL